MAGSNSTAPEVGDIQDSDIVHFTLQVIVILLHFVHTYYLKQSEEYDSEDDPVDTSQPWTVHPTKKDLSDEYRNWSCQGLRVYVMPRNFVPFSFVSHSPEAVRVRVSGSQRFTVEGDDKDCHQEFQGQDFTFPLSSTKKEVQKFMFPDLTRPTSSPYIWSSSPWS